MRKVEVSFHNGSLGFRSIRILIIPVQDLENCELKLGQGILEVGSFFDRLIMQLVACTM